MKRLDFLAFAPFILILMLVISCDRFQGNSNASDDSTLEIPKTIVEIPKLYGKSNDEIKQLLSGGRITEETELSMSYEYPFGTLTSSDDLLGLRIKFEVPIVLDSGRPEYRGESKERLAEMVGVDIGGKVPTSVSPTRTIYEDTIAGKEVEIIFEPVEAGKPLFKNILVGEKN